jgi:dTDP-4-dehydrorhamnose reductase
MKIAISGVNGLLGSTLCNLANEYHFETVSLNRNDFRAEIPLHVQQQHLDSLECSILIHCAANTNVEACELDKFNCYRNNVLLTETLAIICRLKNIKFVFISSTGIYGNYQEEPYCEYDEIHPTTIHHNSKWRAEQSISQLTNNYLTIRTGWLFGGDWDMPKNFVANRIKEALTVQNTIKSDTSQTGNPTFVDDLAKQIFKLIVLNYTGTFNCVNQGSATRFEYVSKIIEFTRLNVLVEPIDSTAFERKAKVSHNESAINFKLNEYRLNSMPCWKESLTHYIETIRHKYEQNQTS